MTDPIRTPAEALQAAAKLQRANAGRDPRTVEAMILGLSARIAAPDDETLVEMVARAIYEADNEHTWADQDDKEYWRVEARAALSALREAGALR